MEADYMYGNFYGWYLKCQSDKQTLAVIPAIHQTGKKRTCSIQIITEEGAWNVSYSGDAFHKIGQNICIGKNRFGKNGVRLTIKEEGLRVRGKLDFGPLHPLKYGIMGPLAFLPFLECRHSVWSMKHSVTGTVYINGQIYSFRNARGYWEGDRGCSFPKVYAWTQCLFPGGSLMLSVADIPIAGFHFNGVICVVLWKGREYRLATYLGARAVKLQDGIIKIVQGDMELEARWLKKGTQRGNAKTLRAPAMGDMVRTIHESAACRAFYRLRKGEKTLFAFHTDKASFEYEYPQ